MTSRLFCFTRLSLATFVLCLAAGNAAAAGNPYVQADQSARDFFAQFFAGTGIKPPDFSDEASGESQPSRQVVTLTAVNKNDSALTNAPLTFGQVFRQGDVPAGRGLIATIDGQRYDLQADVKTRWPDGSMKHAVISIRIPQIAASGGRQEIALATGRENVGSVVISIQRLLATDFNATLTVTRGGQQYTADARQLLQAAADNGGCKAWGKTCKQWLAGPRVSEWIVGGALQGPDGATTNLAQYFNVRAYASPDGSIDHVRVDTVIENNRAYSPTSKNITYDADLRVGDHQYRINNLKHYRQARWHKVLWWRDDPNIYARLDTEYLQSTKAISNYADVTPGTGLLNRVYKRFPPMKNGDQSRRMGEPGAQQAIGPLPRWTSTYVVSGDLRAFTWMLANDDAVGSYGFHYRDAATGRPLEITDHPYVTVADYNHASRAGRYEYRRDLLAPCHSDCYTPYQFDIAHHPSIGYVPYLVTGDFYYLEEMQFTAAYDELWANPKFRNYGQGRLRGAQGQVRGQAWALRSIADAAFATPDSDPMKSYFTQQINTIIADYNKTYTDRPNQHPMHVLDDYGAVIYPLSGQTRVGVAPWQADFFAWSVGHAAELGVPGAKRFSAWLSAFQIHRMIDWQSRPNVGYCYVMASGYKLQIRPAQSASQFNSLDEAYQASFPHQAGLDCGSQQMANSLSDRAHRYLPGEMSGYAQSATGFPANLQIGLAMAAESGADDGAAAWQIFAGRTRKPNYGDYPNFAVVPRPQSAD